MKIFIIIMFVVFSFSGLHAVINENGGYAGSFLRMGLGARSISLGNTGVADIANGYSQYYNPAVLPFLEGKSLSLSYSFMPLDRHTQYIGYSMKVKPAAGVSFGWIESGVNDIQGTNSVGEFTGEINHSLHGIYFSFGRRFGERFNLGLTIKLVMEYMSDNNFDYSSNGVGFNFGALYRVSENLNLAAAIYDVSTSLKANTQDIFQYGGSTVDSFPFLYRIGARYITPLKWIRVLYDFEGSQKGGYQHHFGIEAIHGRNLALRVGMNGNKFVAGAGMDFTLYKFISYVDYAYSPGIIDEGSTHIFSWQIHF